MQNVVDFMTDDDVTITIEATPVHRVGASGVSRDGARPDKDKHFNAIVSRIQKIAAAVSKQMDQLSDGRGKPDETTVEFGMTVSAEADVVVAKGSGEGTFTVTMVWRDKG